MNAAFNHVTCVGAEGTETAPRPCRQTDRHEPASRLCSVSQALRVSRSSLWREAVKDMMSLGSHEDAENTHQLSSRTGYRICKAQGNCGPRMQKLVRIPRRQLQSIEPSTGPGGAPGSQPWASLDAPPGVSALTNERLLPSPFSLRTWCDEMRQMCPLAKPRTLTGPPGRAKHSPKHPVCGFLRCLASS